jgi:serine/threonine protein kinase
MPHFPSVLPAFPRNQLPYKPLNFSSTPRVAHVSLEKASVKPASSDAMTGYCVQTNINATLLDRLRELPSVQRRQVYGENTKLLKALGMKDRPRFTLGRTSRSAPAAPLMQSTAQGGVGWQRFHTELACFATSTDKEHWQTRSLNELRRGLQNAADSSSAVPTMQILLKHENLMSMSSAAREATRDLLRDVLTGQVGGIQLTEHECAQLLCSTFDSVAYGDTKLKSRIAHDVESMPAGFRGRMLALLLDAVSAPDYSPQARELVIELATRAKVKPTTGTPAGNTVSNKCALLTYLNTDPRPQLTEAASRTFAKSLVDGLDPATSPHAEQVAVAQFVLPVAMSMTVKVDDKKVFAPAGGELLAALTGKLTTPSKGKTNPPIADALLAMPMDLRLPTAACLFENLGRQSAPPAALAQGLACMLDKTSKEPNTPPLHECAVAMADMLSRLDGKDWRTYRVVFDEAGKMMKAMDERILALATQTQTERVPEEHGLLQAAKRNIINAIRNEQIAHLKESDLSRIKKDARRKEAETRNKEVAALRKDIAALMVAHDGVVPVCAEQRLQTLRPEISNELEKQAASWNEKFNQAIEDSAKSENAPELVGNPNAQKLTLTHALASRDLVSQLAIAPVGKLGEGGMATTWLYQTSSPVMPMVVLKFPLVGKDTTGDLKFHYEKALTHEFAAYEALHPTRDRDNTRICWLYGMAVDVKHPETGEPCKALAMEFLDGCDMYSMQEELAFETSNRQLLHERHGIYQYANKTMLEASKELAAIGSVHGDLKPENLFVLRDGSIKVIDLGLTRQPGFISQRATGTRRYSAPEKRPGVGFQVQNKGFYVPNSTTDVFEGAYSMFRASELFDDARPDNDMFDPPNRVDGKVMHTDAHGIPYRTPGTILSVSSQKKILDSQHPVGAYEKFYTKALTTENPAYHHILNENAAAQHNLDPAPARKLERLTVAEALQEPYIADPDSPEEAQAALARAVEQYERRKNEATSSAAPYVTSELHRATVPLRREEPLVEGKLTSADEIYDKWAESHPGMAISRACRLLGCELTLESEFAQNFTGIAAQARIAASLSIQPVLATVLQSLCNTVGHKEYTADLHELVADAHGMWFTKGMESRLPSEHATEIKHDAEVLLKVVEEMLSTHANDLRALPMLKTGMLIAEINAWIAHKHGLTQPNGEGVLTDKLANAVNEIKRAIKKLESKLEQVRAEITEKYNDPPDILTSDDVINAIANKLANPAPTGASLRANTEKAPGATPKWRGWRIPNRKMTDSISKSRQVIDVDAENRILQKKRGKGGTGVKLVEDEIVVLKMARAEIAQARDALLDDLRKYWGTANIHSDDPDNYFAGVSDLDDDELDELQEAMRDWLNVLDRMMRVINEADAAEGEDEGAPTTPGQLDRKERFTAARQNIGKILDDHLNDKHLKDDKLIKYVNSSQSATYYVLQQNDRITYSDTPVPGASKRTRFAMADTKDGNAPLQASGRDQGETSELGQTKGDWAISNVPIPVPEKDADGAA